MFPILQEVRIMYLTHSNSANNTKIFEYNLYGGMKKAWNTSEGESLKLLNISPDKYPHLSGREKYAICENENSYQSLYSVNGKLFYGIGNSFYCDGVKCGNIIIGPKYFAGFDNKLIIMPDKLYLDVDEKNLKSLSKSTGFKELSVISTKRESDFPGLNTLICSDGSKTLTDMFGMDTAIYIAVGNESVAGVHRVRGVNRDTGALYFDDGEFGYGENFTATLIITNGIPDGGIIFSCKNRLWTYKGTRIYISADGNPTKWIDYDGRENSSFYIDSGDGEPFTFCTEIGGYPVFFTDNKIYKIYGDRPNNFTLVCCSNFGGIRSSDYSSAVKAGAYLFYLSHGRIMRFSGGVPECDDNFPGSNISSAIGGCDGERYYLSVLMNGGETALYVYDIYSHTWQEYVGEYFNNFAKCRDIFYGTRYGELVAIRGMRNLQENYLPEDDFECEAEYENLYFYNKPVCPVGIGCVLYSDEDSNVSFYLMYNDSGQWYESGEVYGKFSGMKYFGIVPVRTNSLKLKIKAVGNFEIKKVWIEYTV